jgi:hypothetical protein
VEDIFIVWKYWDVTCNSTIFTFIHDGRTTRKWTPEKEMLSIELGPDYRKFPVTLNSHDMFREVRATCRRRYSLGRAVSYV